MIKFHVENGHIVQCEASGRITQIVADIGVCIREIHGGLLINDPAGAAMFKESIKIMVSDPGTPLWNGNMEGICVFSKREIK